MQLELAQKIVEVCKEIDRSQFGIDDDFNIELRENTTLDTTAPLRGLLA